MNNYNPNGQQFPATGYNQYGELFINPVEQANDRKMLRVMGNLFGFAVLLYFAMMFASSFIIGFLQRFFPSVRYLYEDRLMSEAYSSIGAIVFIFMPFMLVYYVLKTKKYTGMLPLGTSYNKKASVYLVMMVLPAMMLTTMAVNVVSSIIQASLGLTFSSGFEDMQTKGAAQILMSVISMAIIPALTEEIAMRGAVLQPLRRYGDRFAVVSTALIFSLIHGNMVQIPYAFFGGLYFGYVAVATGSIWPTIVLHFMNNMFSVIVKCVDSSFGANAANAASYILLLAMIVSGVIGAVLYSRMNYRVKTKKGVKTLKTGEKVKALFLNAPMLIAFIIVIILTSASVSSNG